MSFCVAVFTYFSARNLSINYFVSTVYIIIHFHFCCSNTIFLFSLTFLLPWLQFQFQFSCSVVSDSLWPHEPQHARPPYPSPTPSQPKPMSIELLMPSSHLILCRPLLLLPSIFSSIRILSDESALHVRWPKYWSFSFNISPSNEHPGLISFRMDWLDLLAVQGTLKSLLQHHSSKALILLRSAFFMVHIHTWLLEKQ